MRIHAKEKVFFDSNTFLQLHGELDTRTGAPNNLGAVLRHFYPDLSASLGVGMQYNKRENLRYSVRGKKSFAVTINEALTFNIKGWCDVDKEFKKTKSRGAAEFSWNILDFQKEQDVRVRLGYEMVEKVPYLQIKENNWTFKVDYNGSWNVRYDL